MLDKELAPAYTRLLLSPAHNRPGETEIGGSSSRTIRFFSMRGAAADSVLRIMIESAFPT